MFLYILKWVYITYLIRELIKILGGIIMINIIDSCTALYKRFKETLDECGGYSAEEIATGLAMAGIVTSIVVVTGNGVSNDTEEWAHVYNAVTMAEAVESIITTGSSGPNLGETKEYTLQELLDAEQIGAAEDPSNDPDDADDNFYSKTETKISVKKVESTNSDEATQYDFFVKLVNSDNTYNYLDEIDASTPVEVTEVGRSRILIPARHETGWVVSNEGP